MVKEYEAARLLIDGAPWDSKMKAYRESRVKGREEKEKRNAISTIERIIFEAFNNYAMGFNIYCLTCAEQRTVYNYYKTAMKMFDDCSRSSGLKIMLCKPYAALEYCVLAEEKSGIEKSSTFVMVGEDT